MAIYTLAPGGTRINRSRGGSTFAQCGNTFAIRTRRVPRQKRTTRNTLARSIFQTTQSQWKALSASRQSGYYSRASLWPRIDSIGNSYTFSGPNLWGFKSMAGLQYGPLPNTFAPSPVSIPSWYMQNFSIALDTATFKFQSSTSHVPGGSTFQFFTGMWSTSPHLPQFPSGYRLTYQDSTNPTNNYNIFNEYLATWGSYPNKALPAGQFYYIPFMFRVLHNSNSQRANRTNLVIGFSVH